MECKIGGVVKGWLHTPPSDGSRVFLFVGQPDSEMRGWDVVSEGACAGM